MLPGGSATAGRSRGAYRSYYFLPQYFRRIVKWRQMDLEYTLWQMMYLCISPKTVYRTTSYHKQTKNQWARDDPAFVVITCALVLIAASAYCIAFGNSFAHSLVTVVSAVVIDFLLLGAVLATSGWLLANKYLREMGGRSHAVEQRVEWMYAFDVHCNSYFPLFIALYVVQYFLTPVLMSSGFMSTLLSNLLYAAALSYYHYTQFLGYNALPFLTHTELFLYPIGVILIILPFTIIGGFNPTRFVLGIYFG
mmetsp:Transcript_18198/g.25203  ORF Transcript_18198/g.25203 Transcript_18198/m.25203 type:complete len:251 (-) Transcript_18198:218-970(-)|eukprot:CAMPEP_0196580844 /NCGR_PEP_ID=MMETSP1081-20130531/30970_1 /TAXON_ID=36882 /ORGANISM="Pyramimonas amylifera, Strain CCMP720" /LENGTH=250 /DNA_ID=CAMNT_0041900849 /DNA_START=253 /DNA_END=1005 /DNA_ORIENTATION=-